MDSLTLNINKFLNLVGGVTLYLLYFKCDLNLHQVILTKELDKLRSECDDFRELSKRLQSKGGNQFSGKIIPSTL